MCSGELESRLNLDLFMVNNNRTQETIFKISVSSRATGRAIITEVAFIKDER
jgi:hypothetical protein